MMIWSSKNNDREMSINKLSNEEDFICAFDFTIDTRTPFAKVIVDSIADKLIISYSKIRNSSIIPKVLDQFDSIRSTMDYIRKNYRNLRNMVVEGDDFIIKSYSLEDEDSANSTTELEVELKINRASILYHEIEDSFNGIFNHWSPEENVEHDVDEIVNYCADDKSEEVDTKKEVHSFI